jgi:hypothetical protein
LFNNALRILFRIFSLGVLSSMLKRVIKQLNLTLVVHQPHFEE